MNMLEFNKLKMNKIIYKIIVACVFLTVVSCKKDKSYVYEVNDVNVVYDGSSKPNQKTTTEFISIAYSDLFGSTISNTELVKLSTAYSAFGDKKLIEEMIIKNFLNKPGVILPTKTQMNSNRNLFVSNAYKKLFNREPNEFELWGITNMLTADTSMTPEQVYYAAMTSNEYRYY